eukprot:GEMP01073174.1.p1 GENE.GEMP01073174.1~~GEMP01073174.1.p1  ORF type:complete len:202 (+),score=28.24 GEMP01073174.1:116-721(+)
MVDLSCIWHAHPRAHTDIHETSFSAGFMYTPTLTKLKELALCKSGDAYWNCRLSNFGDRIRYCDKWCGKLGGLSWNKQRMTSCRFYDVDDYLETKALGSLYATHRPYRLHNKAICCSVPPNPLSMLAAVTSKTVKAALQKDLFGSMDCSWVSDNNVVISGVPLPLVEIAGVLVQTATSAFAVTPSSSLSQHARLLRPSNFL